MKPDLNDEDCCYPTGTYWRDHPEGFRYYFGHNERQTGDGMMWLLHCTSNAGGCDAEVHGHTRQEAIDKWNKRA
jgi:hypothetical protein